MIDNILRGFPFSLDAMWAEVSALNLMKAVPALQMPVFFFLGRRDHQVPAETSVADFDVLPAPRRDLSGLRNPDTNRSSMSRPGSMQRWPNWCGQSRCDEIPQRVGQQHGGYKSRTLPRRTECVYAVIAPVLLHALRNSGALAQPTHTFPQCPLRG